MFVRRVVWAPAVILAAMLAAGGVLAQDAPATSGTLGIGSGSLVGPNHSAPIFGNSLTANLAAGSLLSGNPSPAVADDAFGGDWFNPGLRPGLYATVEALILHRDNHTIDQPLVVNSFTGATVMTTRDLGFSQWTPGARVTLGYQFDSGAAMEGVWFGFQDWNSSAQAANPGSLSAPAGLGAYSYDFNRANAFSASYNAKLQNFEANWLWPAGRFRLLAGFRYLSWNEYLDINGTASYHHQPESSDYTIGTYNNLFGAQIGAKTQGNWRRLRWDVVEKLGLFGNGFWQRSLLQDDGNNYIAEDNWLSHAGVAFVNDLGLNLGLRITDGWILRAGYNLILIDGLALAPNQLDFHVGADSGTAHNHQGSVLLQGVNAGLELHW